MDKLLRFSSGIFAGLGTTISLVSVPSILSSSDPLPSWKRLYNLGKNVALTTIVVSSGASIKCFLDSNDVNYLYCGAILLVVPIFTLIFIKPVNDQLFNCRNDDKQVIGLIQKWNRLQWIRTILGVSAFVFNLFQLK
jgi:hypothetical protein